MFYSFFHFFCKFRLVNLIPNAIIFTTASMKNKIFDFPPPFKHFKFLQSQVRKSSFTIHNHLLYPSNLTKKKKKNWPKKERKRKRKDKLSNLINNYNFPLACLSRTKLKIKIVHFFSFVMFDFRVCLTQWLKKNKNK